MNATVAIGALTIDLPGASSPLPEKFLEHLIFGFVMEREGHASLASRQIAKLHGWLSHGKRAPADIAAKRAAFTAWFGISTPQASLLTHLYEARGGYITTGDLSAKERVSHEALITRVSRLRQAMECEAIDSERGLGYRLTEIGTGECRTAMDRFRDSLA